ncbi:hypothetical protein G210_1775 [Candida maltosa Xu316]|uniref:Uncharacterized protein n=1 Tax=Candida maltosa (strain Xu316) TaxID=1245528 RepID=M3JZA9_CANMX|nr:hypothetical protein G210_1775 [Candida maltosa Xu316]
MEAKQRLLIVKKFLTPSTGDARSSNTSKKRKRSS